MTPWAALVTTLTVTGAWSSAPAAAGSSSETVTSIVGVVSAVGIVLGPLGGLGHRPDRRHGARDDGAVGQLDVDGLADGDHALAGGLEVDGDLAGRAGHLEDRTAGLAAQLGDVGGHPDGAGLHRHRARGEPAGLLEAEGLLPLLERVGGGGRPLLVDGQLVRRDHAEGDEVGLDQLDVGTVLDPRPQLAPERPIAEQQRDDPVVDLRHRLAAVDDRALGREPRHGALGGQGELARVAVAEGAVELGPLLEVADGHLGGRGGRLVGRAGRGAVVVAGPPGHDAGGEQGEGAAGDQCGGAAPAAGMAPVEPDGIGGRRPRGVALGMLGPAGGLGGPVRAGWRRRRAQVGVGGGHSLSSSSDSFDRLVRPAGHGPRPVHAGLLAALLHVLLELLVRRSAARAARAGLAADNHPAVVGDLRVGHVVAAGAHALGHGCELVLHLGLFLGAELDVGAGLLEDRLALLLGRLELLRLGVDAAVRPHPERDPALAVELGIGHVDAVVPHALGVLEHGVLHLAVVDAAAAAGAVLVVLVAGFVRGGALVDGRHPVVFVAAAAPAPGEQPAEQEHGGEPAHLCGHHARHDDDRPLRDR